MTVRPPAPETALGSAALLRSRSTLVRQLVQAEHDPGKERIRACLCAIDDERRMTSRFCAAPQTDFRQPAGDHVRPSRTNRLASLLASMKAPGRIAPATL